MNLLIVDDHILFREGLVSVLSSSPKLLVVGEAGSYHEAIEKAIRLKPDVVLMDISLPDGSGLEAMRAILSHRPETKVVILTVHETDDLLLEAIRNGAVGYLLKNIPASKLITTLSALEQGETALSRTMITRVVRAFQRQSEIGYPDKKGLNLLTARELEILKFLSSEVSNQEIANRLYISENTVKVHIHNILKKLEFRNRKELVQFARRAN